VRLAARLGCIRIARTDLRCVQPLPNKAGEKTRKRQQDSHDQTAQKTGNAGLVLQAPDARGGSRAARISLRGDPPSLRRGRAGVAFLPARPLPASQTLRRRYQALPQARVAAAARRAAEGRLRSGRGRRAAPPAAGDAHGMALAPISTLEFRSLNGSAPPMILPNPSPLAGEGKNDFIHCPRRSRRGRRSAKRQRGAACAPRDDDLRYNGKPVPTRYRSHERAPHRPPDAAI
jgi:hypothetical protein